MSRNFIFFSPLQNLITCIDMKHNICILNGESLTPSTLLIPKALLPLFRQKERKFKSVRNLFHFVVNTGHSVYNRRPNPLTGKISYQPEGMNLQKINFFPNNEDWERFRTFSYLQRVSMTSLFVMLLVEWGKFETSARVPMIPEKVKLILSLNITKIFTYLELQRLNL